ncbi:MAG: formate dehydrogenase subunit gamma, partial [Phycisphaerae bacterium]
CHPGADKALAAAAVHLDLPSVVGTLEYALAAAFIILTAVTFGPLMVIVVLELFALIVGREHHAAERMERLTVALWAHPDGRRRLTRFTVCQRIQHWVLAILFVLLALTGFPLKFADHAWARALIEDFGGLSQARQIHHWVGIALIVGFVVHLIYILWTMLPRMRVPGPDGVQPGLRRAITSLPMWIGPRDVLKMGQLLAYLMFLRKEPPTFGRFSVKEKFEYIGVFWGTTLLGVTGALLWGEQIATRFLSGRVLNIALIAHTYEAFLAVIHVGILHIINVMLSPAVFPLSLATLSGRTPTAALAEEHSDQVLEVAHELGVSTAEVDSHD